MTAQPSTASYTPSTKITCPCCGRAATITKAGLVRQHGHTNRGGMYRTNTVCPATWTNSVSNSLKQALFLAEHDLQAAMRAYAAKPAPRLLQNIEARSADVVACRTALGL